jgi:iron complex transport system substrate-binding protein
MRWRPTNGAHVAALSIIGLYLLVLLQALSAPTVDTQRNARALGSSYAPAPLRRIVDIGTLPYFLAIQGSADSLVAFQRTQLDQVREIQLDRRFPALAQRPGIRLPVGPEQLMTYEADALFVVPGWLDDFSPYGFPRLVQIDYDPRASMEEKALTWGRLGVLTGNEGRARLLTDAYRTWWQQLADRLRDQSEVKVAVLVGGPGYWNITGDGYYLNTLLGRVKGRNAADIFLNSPQVDLEHLAELDPSVILLNSQPGDSAVPETLYRDPNWGILRAVRERRVYKMPRLSGFLGPVEEPLLLQWLAEVLHPQLPGSLRPQYVAAYQSGYGYTPNAAEIDRMIRYDDNRHSSGYERFAAH